MEAKNCKMAYCFLATHLMSIVWLFIKKEARKMSDPYAHLAAQLCALRQGRCPCPWLCSVRI